jgi:hypothetical protein
MNAITTHRGFGLFFILTSQIRLTSLNYSISSGLAIITDYGQIFWKNCSVFNPRVGLKGFSISSGFKGSEVIGQEKNGKRLTQNP